MRLVGRYAIDAPFASGGMATVHLGRAKGPLGFARTVAVKRLLPAFASDAAFRTRFLIEARVASRVRHANVVPTLDVVAEGDELLIVMEYVAGLSLASVLAATPEGARAGARAVPLPIVSALVIDVLEGLHAAHNARSEEGAPLGLVHRDVSPHNILVGVDGIARVIDFGIATAADHARVTRDGHVRGKLGYIAPEHLLGDPVSFAADIYGASVVLWELLANRRLRTENDRDFTERAILGDHDGPRKYAPEVPVPLEELVMKGLAASPSQRFASAREMALALQQACPRAAALDVAAWLEGVAGATLKRDAEAVARFERMPERQLTHAEPSVLGHVAYDATRTLTQPLERAAATPRARVRPWAVVALVASLATVAAAAVVVARPRASAPAPPRAAALAPPRIADPPAPAGSVAPTAVSPVSPPPESSDERQVAPSAPATTRPPLARAAAVRHTRSAPSAPSAAAPAPDPCRVPYYFDADGTKHYRPECVR